MASIINATTTAGVAVTGDNSGALALQTNNGTTAVTIDTSQRVLIGATSASGFDSAGDDLVVGAGSGSTGLTIYSGTTGVGTINFADGTSGSAIYAGGMNYNHSTNRLSFYTNDGTSQMYVTSTGDLQFNSGYGSVATAYGCRAWINFNGTGTVAIRGSGNVSSLTDSGTGDYRVNFTTAMPDTNYSVVASSINSGVAYALASSSTQTTSQCGVATFLNSAPNTNADVNTIFVAVFR